MSKAWEIERIDGSVREEIRDNWTRWVCTKCGKELEMAAPCEWYLLDDIRRKILGLGGTADRHRGEPCELFQFQKKQCD